MNAYKSLRYARVLIEISRTKPLPSKLNVKLAQGLDMEVDVQYSWKTYICTSCRLFGHISDTCLVRPISTSQSRPTKIPLPRPVLKWVSKNRNPTPSTYPVISISIVEVITAISYDSMAFDNTVYSPMSEEVIYW